MDRTQEPNAGPTVDQTPPDPEPKVIDGKLPCPLPGCGEDLLDVGVSQDIPYTYSLAANPDGSTFKANLRDKIYDAPSRAKCNACAGDLPRAFEGAITDWY